MSFSNRNLNPNIWDASRHNNQPPFINNQQNFYGNNNTNFPRPNYYSQQNQIRPLLNLSTPPISGQHHPNNNYRNNFNNNGPDHPMRSNRGGRPNFHNQKNWQQNRGNDNKDSRFNDNSNNGERFKREPSEESLNNDDSRPKSLVEQLKSTMKKNPRSKSQEKATNDSIDACARNASKKLLDQLKTMDKDDVKELINNPKQPHKKAVLNIQAREKLREGMRKQLNKLGAEDDNETSFDHVETVNYENIPETLIAQIGRTIDTDMQVEDMDIQQEMDDEIIEDKDIEVVKKNLGNDFLYGSEMLLMNGFNLLGESENESELKISDDKLFPPPLPSEPILKPPEPVPQPDLPPPTEQPSKIAVWTNPSIKQPPQRFENDWHLDMARNPDPPANIETIQSIQVIVSNPPSQSTSNVSLESVSSNNPLLISLSESSDQVPAPKHNSSNLKTLVSDEKVNKLPHSTLSQDSFKTPSIPDRLNASTPISSQGEKTPVNSDLFNDDGLKTPYIGDNDGSKTPFDGRKTLTAPNDLINKSSSDKMSSMTPENSITASNPPPDEGSESKTERRANETYGEYRRRIANLDVDDELNKPKISEEFNRNRPPPPLPANRNAQIWDDSPSPQQQNDKTSWMSNNQRNNNNNNNNNNSNNNAMNSRKSRFEMNRSRDNNRNDRSNFGSNSRKANPRDNNANSNNAFWDNRDRDRETAKDMKDAFNYRFDNSGNNDGNEIDRLNTLLNPKPVQFKGSFNKRSGYSGNHSRDHNRSNSRERTPPNNSVEREFSDMSIPSTSDVRPCSHTLKKIVEIENEISRIHDKIHGIDKVITNLQTERVGYQKTFTRLQHDKKVLFDNLIKRTMQQESNESSTSRERDKERSIDVTTIKKEKEGSIKKVTSHESILDQKKRKATDSPVTVAQPDDEMRKKKKYMIEEEPKSAAQKAKEREDEERRKRIEESRRQKQLRREREEAERRRLEEEVKKESNDTILVINRDKAKRKEKDGPGPNLSPKLHKKDKMSKLEKFMFKYEDVIDPGNIVMKKILINFQKLPLPQNILDDYRSGNCPQVNVDEIAIMPTVCKLENKDAFDQHVPTNQDEQLNKQSKSVDEVVSPPNDKSVDIEKDPLMLDDNQEITNPPTTPGSSLTLNDDDTSTSCPTNDQDYSEWTGCFESHDQPIVHIQNINDRHMVCAAEDGKLYKYNLTSGKCKATFDKHTEICNSFLYEDKEQTIYTASSDGFVYRIKFKLFDSIESKQFNEPLQVIEKSKYALYVGAKSGNIYKLKMDLSDQDVEPLCCVDSLILCMRWSKEGSRHVLLISSRMNAIQVRDANDGLLLRTLSNDLTGVSIYDMILDGSTIYCGSNLHEIFALDFTTGALIKKHNMSGAGAICVRIYKSHLIVACYDGNIYIFDLNSDDDAVNITGPSNMLLAMDLWNDKIIASTKDKTLKIMNIPT